MSAPFGGAGGKMAALTREAIIEAAKRVAADCGGVLSRADFERLTSISQHQLYKAFPDGGWSEVLQLAGIQRHPLHNEPVSDEELLAEFHRVASELGQIPTWQQFGARASVSYDVVKKRFGGMQGTLGRKGQGPSSARRSTFAGFDTRRSTSRASFFCSAW
jgi:hypothetical protein